MEFRPLAEHELVLLAMENEKLEMRNGKSPDLIIFECPGD
jgi:hypothetical protein